MAIVCRYGLYVLDSRSGSVSLERVEAIDRNSALLKVYQKTREAAHDPALVSSRSQSITTMLQVSSVRLCSFPNAADFVDEAHLCPKTNTGMKTSTWIYVASAVLGMERETANDRVRLEKALCGSCEPGGDVASLTGLNRSPFNMLLFGNQGIWFDRNPSVLVLPVKSPSQARDWDGTS